MIMAFTRKTKSSGKTDNKGQQMLYPKPKSTDHLIKPGQVLNAKGRPKGSRNKFAESFIQDFIADWEVAGAAAIQRVRLEDPSTYLRVAASIVPKEFTVKDESDLDKILEQFSGEELSCILDALAAVGAQAQGGTRQAKRLT